MGSCQGKNKDTGEAFLLRVPAGRTSPRTSAFAVSLHGFPLSSAPHLPKEKCPLGCSVAASERHGSTFLFRCFSLDDPEQVTFHIFNFPSWNIELKVSQRAYGMRQECTGTGCSCLGSARKTPWPRKARLHIQSFLSSLA